MKRLTLIQINHLTARADVLFDDMARKEKTKLGPRPDVPHLTFDEQVDLIRRGKAKLKPDTKLNQHTYLVHCFDYPVTAIKARAIQARKTWDDKAAVIDAKYKARKVTFVDAAILGDSTDALEALRALETEMSKD